MPFLLIMLLSNDTSIITWPQTFFTIMGVKLVKKKGKPDAIQAVREQMSLNVSQGILHFYYKIRILVNNI